MDFTYELPTDLKKRVYQFLVKLKGEDVANAFNRCACEHEDVGDAYQAGIKKLHGKHMQLTLYLREIYVTPIC